LRQTVRRLFFIGIFTYAFGVHAADFPLQTDEAETLPVGELEFQATLESARAKSEGTTVRSTQLEMQLEYGVEKNLTLILEIPVVRERTQTQEQTARANGVGDALAGMKWRFFKRGDLHLGVKADLSIPTGSEEKGLGSGKLGSAAALLASIEREDRCELHANLGAVMPRYKDALQQEGARKTLPRAALGGLLNVSDDLRVAAGVETVRARDKDASGWENSFALGAVYDLGRARNLAVRFLRQRAGGEREISWAFAYTHKL
jgi:hypothetical protein